MSDVGLSFAYEDRDPDAVANTEYMPLTPAINSKHQLWVNLMQMAVKKMKAQLTLHNLQIKGNKPT